MPQSNFHYWVRYRYLLILLTLLVMMMADSRQTCPATAQNSCSSNSVDVVFVMDTSGSMDDEFEALCSNIGGLVSALQGRGIQVTHTILGISNYRSCTIGTVSQNMPGALARNIEDWGPAVRDVAVSHNWQPGATRLIIPMSDEAPFDGEPCEDPGFDRDAIETASAAARRNGVRVAPILGTGYTLCTQNLAMDLARNSGGQVFYSTSPAQDLADGIDTIIQATACDTDGDGLPDDQDPFPTDPCRPDIQAVCLPPQTCGLTTTPHWDDDGDGRTDEEQENRTDDDGDGLIDEDVGGVNCPFPDQDCGVNSHRYFDDDNDGKIDEEPDDGVDNDADGYIDEDVSCTCPPQQDIGLNERLNVDDDGDFSIDEEIDNGVDDDGDGCIDEDISAQTCPAPQTPGTNDTPGVDDDNDGQADEEIGDGLDDDGDGCVDEDVAPPAGCPAPQVVGTNDTPGVDDDNDGQVDEEVSDGFDNDEDGCIDEDVTSGLTVTPVPPPPPNAGAATVLLVDISGSMANPWQGGMKIESVKKAASKVVNIIEQDSQLPETLAADQVVVASFSTNAQRDFGPSTDYGGARAVISGLTPMDKTNLGAGLEVAIQSLQTVPTTLKKVIFLLSDGQPNEGLTPEQILSGPVQSARNAGICIYTIGFGEKSDLDEVLLQQIASRSGCGTYSYAAAWGGGVLALENEFIRNRHESVRSIVTEFSGEIRQDEAKQPNNFTVATDQDILVGTVNWPGSKVSLVLTDPRGKKVDQEYSGAKVSESAGLEYWAVENPEPGNWQVAVVGQDLPAGTEPFNVILSARQAASRENTVEVEVPQNEGSGTLFVFFVVALLSAVGVTTMFAIRNRRGSVAGAGLRLIAGHASPPFAPLQGEQLRMGRGKENELVITDKDASRHHARILKTTHGYLIEDLGSTNGTYVNGQRIERQMLTKGDVVQIGLTQFRFETGQ